MGVKETPITADEDEGEGDNGSGEEAPEEQETKEETPPEEAKPKRAKAKPKAAKKVEEKPKKKAEEKPKKKPEEKPEMPEEMPKPAKPKAKKETVDLKTKTACSICKSGPISTDALLYTHSCKKEALAKRKTAPLFDEAPKAPGASPWQSEAQPSGYAEPPPLSYREILAREQQEMRRQKAARIVNPIRAHFFGYAQ